MVYDDESLWLCVLANLSIKVGGQMIYPLGKHPASNDLEYV